MTLKCGFGAMFVNVNLQTEFGIYDRHFYDLSVYQISHDSLVITIKPETKENVSAATMLSCYILQKMLPERYLHGFHCTSFEDPEVKGAGVCSTSQTCGCVMLLLLAVGN
jgi:hypothetical protein